MIQWFHGQSTLCPRKQLVVLTIMSLPSTFGESWKRDMVRKMLPEFLNSKKELAHISQGSIDISSYYNNIKQLWNQIIALSVTRVRTCSTCGAKSDYQKDEVIKKVYQFLMGLNDIYIQSKSNIIMIKSFPSVSTVYSILLSDEKQR